MIKIQLGSLVPGKSYHTVYNWTRRGLMDVNGEYQRLRCYKTVHGLCSTIADLEDFERRLNGEV